MQGTHNASQENDMNEGEYPDGPRFTVLDSANESNRIDEVSTAAGFPCAGIVDEKLGGIYIYVAADAGAEESPDSICGRLNAGDLPQD